MKKHQLGEKIDPNTWPKVTKFNKKSNVNKCSLDFLKLF